MSRYNPDYWQVVKLTNSEGESHFRVFATWVGGYVNGDSWKLNSGITKCEREGKFLNFHGSSGSIYSVPDSDHCYRNSGYTGGVLHNLIEKSKANGVTVELMPYSMNWVEMNYE